MANQVVGISLNIDTSKANESVGSLKKQFREAQAEVVALSEKFGATSKEAIEAAKKAADLRDRIGDAKALTDAFNPDAKFKAFTASLSAVAGGFGAVQGAIGLLGVKSEEVEKTLLKVQSAMAISEGLQAVGEGIDSFKQLGAVIQSTTLFQKANNAVTIVAATVQKAFGVATVGVGRAFNVLKGAIAATGIGLLIVAIGTVVTKLMEWSDSTKDTEEAQARLNHELEKQNELLKQNLDELDYANKAQIARARIAGKSEADITKIQKEGQQKRLDLLKKDFEQAVARESSADFAKLGLEEQDRIRKENSQRQKDYFNERDKIEADALEQQAKTAEKAREKQKADSEKASADRKAQLEADAEFEEQQRQYQIDRLRTHTEEANKLREADLKKIDEQLKLREEANKRVADAWESTQEDLVKGGLDRINALQSQAEQRRTLLAQYLVGNQAIELANLDAEYEAKRKLIAGNEEAELALTEDFEKRKKDVKLKYENQKLEIVQNGLNNVANIVGKQTAAGKAMAIASATIDTYQAANSALKADYGKFGPVSQVLRFIAVASTIATGIKSIKEIAKTKVPGGASVSTPSLPNVNTSAPVQPQEPQAMMTQLNQQSINQLGSATSRAYVVETDVTNSQERIKRINRAARLS